MKRFAIIFCIAALLAGLILPARSEAEDDHPILLTVTCDPEPELEGDGVIPDLLFTIRNTGDTDYTIENAVLTGGYENAERILTESITVLAGGTKEFHLTDVPVLDAQLNVTVTYVLSWEESEPIEDEASGVISFITHKREAKASIRLERFVMPELTVSASCDRTSVRADETFQVVYTVTNDTAFDMTGLRLYDPEQSMQSIQLPDSDLSAGGSITVRVEYRMGTANMTFDPRIEYIVRRREMETHAEKALTVESVVVSLALETEMRPATAEGTTFAITVRNNGSHTVTNICLYDEINTLLSEPFDLVPEGYRTVLCTVLPAVSSDRARTVRFHVQAVDPMGQPIEISDPREYSVVPYIMPDAVQLGLSAVLKSPYYNEDGKLCASIQFVIRNSGDVKIFNAVLREITLFGDVKSYEELRHGDTYYTQIYQLDGVKELKFRVEAVDPAGVPRSSDIVRLDLTGLKELADRKNDPQHVYTQNAYFQDIDQKYGGVLRIAAIIGLSVAAVCAIVCVVLYAVELRIRNKLPAEFEDEMERTLRSTKRRTEKQLFSDAPTEQFGYTAPIKLRNYGELTEEEAKARRALYEKGMRETLKKTGAGSAEAPKRPPEPVRIDADGTRVIPVVRRQTVQPNAGEAKTDPSKTANPSDEPMNPVVRTAAENTKTGPALQSEQPAEETIRIYSSKRAAANFIKPPLQDVIPVSDAQQPAGADAVRPQMPDSRPEPTSETTPEPDHAMQRLSPEPASETDAVVSGEKTERVPESAEQDLPPKPDPEYPVPEQDVYAARPILRTVWRADDLIEPEQAPPAPDVIPAEEEKLDIPSAQEPEQAPPAPDVIPAEEEILDIPSETENTLSDPASGAAGTVGIPLACAAVTEQTRIEPDPGDDADLSTEPSEIGKPRKLFEKPTPARRPAVLQPIKRMERETQCNGTGSF